MGWTLYADGASRGNPGPSGIGAVLYDPDGEVVDEIAGMIGETTNNVAEYRALVAGLEAAARRGVDVLTVRLDSQLLVRQATGEYRVKAKHLRPLALRVRRLAEGFEEVRFEHVPRAENAVADALANQGLDDALEA
ncbi:MAG: ribonuclease HI family protein [Acidimicrobiia bacterium]|nr:ribonuclease HI family protein [Acidimicrobiia bacterium]